MAETALLGGLIMRKRRDHRNPGVCGMTRIAKIAGQWMIARFEGTRTDTVVTTGTGAGLTCHRGMIKRYP